MWNRVDGEQGSNGHERYRRGETLILYWEVD